MMLLVMQTRANPSPVDAHTRIQRPRQPGSNQRASHCKARVETHSRASHISSEQSWLESLSDETKRWQDHPIQGFGKRSLVTRLATQADAYPVADCHVSVFNPKTLLKPFLIIDRVLALLVSMLQSSLLGVSCRRALRFLTQSLDSTATVEKTQLIRSTQLIRVQIGDQHNTAEQQKRRNNRALSELAHQQGYESENGPTDEQPFTNEAQIQTAEPREAGDRCFCCFVADSQPEWALHSLDSLEAQSSITKRDSDHEVSGGSAARHTEQNEALEAPLWARLVCRALNCQLVADCWGVSYTQRGLLGTIVYDTFGYHIPGQFQGGRWYRRRNIGYISNLAVVPGARRQGIASMLVARCEAVARQDPKIEAVVLHVGRLNGPGKRLYESQGYTAVDEASEWKELLGLNNRNSDLQLMVKRMRPPGDIREA